jgi:hypothetical protein
MMGEFANAVRISHFRGELENGSNGARRWRAKLTRGYASIAIPAFSFEQRAASSRSQFA